MEFLYLRVSTNRQSVDTQERDLLLRYPAGKVYAETASGVKRRPILRELVAKVQPGDTIVVAALDRLGRRLIDILTLIEDLEARGVNLVSLREGIDYRTPAGRIVTQVLLAVAELERNLISERTLATMRTLKAKGIKLGRPRTYSDETIGKVRAMREAGANYKTIQKATGMSIGKLSQILGSAR